MVRIVFVKAGGKAVYRPTGLMVLSLSLHQGMPCGVNLQHLAVVLCDVLCEFRTCFGWETVFHVFFGWEKLNSSFRKQVVIKAIQ